MMYYPFFSHQRERDERGEAQERFGNLTAGSTNGYDMLLSLGWEVIDATRAFRTAYPHGCFIGRYMINDEDCKRRSLYDRMELAEKILREVCYVIHGDQTAIVRAARIQERYYERGGSKILDAERLIRSQM